MSVQVPPREELSSTGTFVPSLIKHFGTGVDLHEIDVVGSGFGVSISMMDSRRRVRRGPRWTNFSVIYSITTNTIQSHRTETNMHSWKCFY